MPLPPEPAVRIEYHLEYQLPTYGEGERFWTDHAMTTGEEAAKIAVSELRDVTPGWLWRVVKYETIEQVMDW